MISVQTKEQRNRVLVTSVHPDDETLGCGGTILRHKSLGDELYWLILTNISRETGWDSSAVERREREIQAVAEAYSFEETIKLDLPTTKLDTIPMKQLIEGISGTIGRVQPDTIYCPNRSDVHTDHQIAFKAIMSCTKSFRFPFIKRILMYECLSETEFAPALPESAFLPNVFVDITEHLEKKIEIMQIYDSEMMPPHYPRSPEAIEALARFRGCRIGKEYAEAFMLLLEVL